MKVYSARETADLLPYKELSDAVADVLRAAAWGEAQAPPRLVHSLPDGGSLLLMPASDGRMAVTKVLTVLPGNAHRGLPLISADVLALDAATGERLGILDGQTVTARRTAAASLLAARTLARGRGGPLLVVGAGVQARAHLEAFASGLGVRQAYLCSRSGQNLMSLANHALSLGVDASVVASPAEVLSRCPLVVTATTSREPVLPDDALDLLMPGAFIAAVGSFTPEAAEIPPGVVRGAFVVADTPDVRHEAGDLIRADVDWGRVSYLADVLDGPAPEGPVFYKSVGSALFDLAAARLALG
ncbi:delta(1)-pyrroline-2-carboxylate reductase family protein [Desulfocurvus sp. DL9XJH121]